MRSHFYQSLKWTTLVICGLLGYVVAGIMILLVIRWVFQSLFIS